MWQAASCPAAMRSPASARVMVALVSVSWACSREADRAPPPHSRRKKCCTGRRRKRRTAAAAAGDAAAPRQPPAAIPTPYQAVADAGLGSAAASRDQRQASLTVQLQGVEREGGAVELRGPGRHGGRRETGSPALAPPPAPSWQRSSLGMRTLRNTSTLGPAGPRVIFLKGGSRARAAASRVASQRR